MGTLPPTLIQQGIEPHPGPDNKYVHLSINARSLHKHWPSITLHEEVHTYAIQEGWHTIYNYNKLKAESRKANIATALGQPVIDSRSNFEHTGVALLHR